MHSEIPPVHHSLSLQNLRLFVRLGCEVWERSAPQEVLVSIELRFAAPPAGVLSDELTDTVCYADIAQSVLEHCQNREYKLVEKMGLDIYHLVKEKAGKKDQVAISVHKVQPPIPRLSGGSIYRCGDFSA